jgi:hypothetical protein
VTDGRAPPLVVPSGDGTGHVIGIARGDAEPDYVEQQILAFAPDGGGEPRGLERRDAVGKALGDGSHAYLFRLSQVPVKKGLRFSMNALRPS